MSEISVTKKDIIWGYLAQFFLVASGLITLPLVLNILSAEEIGMNYLMLTIGSLVSLLDFGFAPQFGRNITYIFSGAQKLQKEGISTEKGDLNYKLLATMISAAKLIYKVMAVVVLVIMLTLGTVYIYKATMGFTSVKYALLIWVIYSISAFFAIYYTYYTSLLMGKGLIMESKKAMLASRITCILLTFIFLFMGWGLLGIAVANLLAPFVNRYFSYRYFFVPELRNKIENYYVNRKEKWEIFSIIWYNAKKLGMVFIGNYAISKLSLFLAGLYLSLQEIASYGLMIQLVTVLTVSSVTLFTISEPYLISLRIEDKRSELLKRFSFTMNVYYCLFIIGSLFLIILAPLLLEFIGSNTKLPSTYILTLYCFVIFLENNNCNFSTFILLDNKIPFMWPSLCTGVFIIMGDFLILQYTSFALGGLIMVQLICQSAYVNWRWIYVVCRDFKISFSSFLALGLKGTFNKIRLSLFMLKY